MGHFTMCSENAVMEIASKYLCNLFVDLVLCTENITARD